MSETCKSCGKAWTDHLGVEPTCALLVEAVAILNEIGVPVREGRGNAYGHFVCIFCGQIERKGHYKRCVLYKRDEFLEKVEAYLKKEQP